MKIQRDGKLVKWAYLMSVEVPGRVSVCVLFWRAVLLTPCKLLYKLLMALMVVSFVGATLYVLVLAMLSPAGRLGLGLGLLTVGLWFMLLVVSETKWASDSLIISYIKAKKTKICPLIDLVDTKED